MYLECKFKVNKIEKLDKKRYKISVISDNENVSIFPKIIYINQIPRAGHLFSFKNKNYECYKVKYKNLLKIDLYCNYVGKQKYKTDNILYFIGRTKITSNEF